MTGMKRRDARALDHKTFAEIRIRAMEQDPKRVRRWLEQEYPLIRRQARAVGADIYFGDEAGVRSDHHAGTTWGVKGQTPVVRTTGQRSSVNMISAVSARGHMRFMLAKADSTEQCLSSF